jgi:hypothetical protein
MTRTLDREAFRRCLALEPWEQDEIGEDIPDSEWTTTVGEVLALAAPAASGSTIGDLDDPGPGVTG